MNYNLLYWFWLRLLIFSNICLMIVGRQSITRLRQPTSREQCYLDKIRFSSTLNFRPPPFRNAGTFKPALLVNVTLPCGSLQSNFLHVSTSSFHPLRFMLLGTQSLSFSLPLLSSPFSPCVFSPVRLYELMSILRVCRSAGLTWQFWWWRLLHCQCLWASSVLPRRSCVWVMTYW